MEIPPEIINDILHRLPAKSLARFRCVSKNWLTQTTDPQFIKHHIKTLNRHHLIFDSNNTSLYNYSLPINPHNRTLTNLNLTLKPPHTPDVFIFHGSCNGLVLGLVEVLEDFVNAHSLVVFNPTTKEVVELPESGYDVINNLLEIDIMYGFGYDSVTDDYKVVTVSYFHYNYLIPPDNIYVHVYSLKDNNWRRVGDSPYDHSHGRSLPGVFVNGFIHWVVSKGLDGLRVIVAFSLVDERFCEVPLPDLGDRGGVMSKSGWKLVVVGEKLGVFVEDEVWLMNEYGVRESWSKILVYGLNEISMVDPEIFYEDGKILFVSGGLVWVYDVEEKCFCKSIDVSRNVKGLKVKGSYIESLVSPKLS